VANCSEQKRDNDVVYYLQCLLGDTVMAMTTMDVNDTCNKSVTVE